MKSSLTLRNSVRESSAPIEIAQICHDRNLFMTIDEHALRIWSSDKQIKSFHRSTKARVILLEYIKKISCFLYIYIDKNTKKAIYELWDTNLTMVYQGTLDIPKLRHFAILGDYSYAVATDALGNLTMFTIDITSTVVPHKGPWFPKERDFKAPPKADDNYKHRISFDVAQSLTIEETNMKSAQVLKLFDESVFLIASSSTLFVYKRRRPRKHLRVSITSVNSKEPRKPAPTEWAAFKLWDTFECFSKAAPVCSVEFLSSSQMLIVAYTSGAIGVYHVDELLFHPSGEINRDEGDHNLCTPVEIIHYRAHIATTPSATARHPPLTTLALCPWKTLFGEETYVIEYFSLSSDYKLMHWGVRKAAMANDGSDFAVDILGVYEFPIEFGELPMSELHSPSSRFSELPNPHAAELHTTYKFSVIPFETPATDAAAPKHKSLMCSVGGMMATLLIHQPARILVTYEKAPQPVVSYAIGRSLDNPLAVTEEEVMLHSSRTILLLCDGVISAASMQTGEILYHMNTLHMPDTLSGVEDLNHSMKASVAYKALQGKLAPMTQGAPSTIYWCEYSQNFVVGYSDGSVSLFSSDDGFLSPEKRVFETNICERLKSQVAHSTPIRNILSFQEVAPLGKKVLGTWLFVGDAAGVLSAWIIPLHRSGKNRTKLNWTANAHQDEIVNIRSVSFPLRVGDAVQYISVVISACSRGVVKAWSMDHKPGEWSLVGCHKTGAKLTSMCVVMLPYLHVPERAQSSAMSVGSKSAGGTTASGDTTTIFDEVSESTEQDVIVNPIYYHIICTVGYQSGVLSTWIFTNNLENASTVPLSALEGHSSSIISLQPVKKNSPIYVTGKHRHDRVDVARVIVSAEADGACCLLGILWSGGIVRLHQYYNSGPTLGILVDTLTSSTGDSIEIVQVNDKSCFKFLGSSAKGIPESWRTPPQFIAHIKLDDEEVSEGGDSVQSLRSARSIPMEYMPSHELTTPRRSRANTYDGADTPDLDRSATPVLDFTKFESTQFDPISVHSPSSSSVTSLGNAGGMRIGHLSLKNLKRISKMDIFRRDRAIRHSQSKIDVQIPGSSPPVKDRKRATSASTVDDSVSWNITLDMMNELHLVKKDKALLDLFRQNAVNPSAAVVTTSRKAAIEVLDRWLAVKLEGNEIGDNVSQKVLCDLFDVIGITENDSVDMLQLAKIGAVLLAVHKSSLHKEMFSSTCNVGTKHRLRKDYAAMNTSRTLVRYNAMGEKVLEKRDFSKPSTAGIPRGYADTIRKIWNEETSRVPFHVNDDSATMMSRNVMLLKIPRTLKPLLDRKAKLPSTWSPNMEHWFSLRRAVRVCRTLLDMRLSAQQEFMLGDEKASAPTNMSLGDTLMTGNSFVGKAKSTASTGQLPSFDHVVVKYFERNFGGGDMHLAHVKILHFLEACWQYSEYPVLNCIRYFLCPHDDEVAGYDARENYVWLYVEARHFMMSRSMIRNGDVITAGEHMSTVEELRQGSIFENSICSISNIHGPVLMWQLIRRGDALTTVDEILRVRGGYGSRLLDSICRMIDSLSPVGGAHLMEYDLDRNIEDDLLDVEHVLEAFIFEIKKYDTELRAMRDIVFGQAALPKSVVFQSMPMSDSPPVSPSKYEDIFDETSLKDKTLTLLNQLHKLLLRFLTLDPQRLGLVTQGQFESVITDNVPSSADYQGKMEIDELVKVSKLYFASSNVQEIAYADFIAMITSFVLQEGHAMYGLDCNSMKHALNVVKRGIDQIQGEALVYYIGHGQDVCQNDPYWMARLVHQQTYPDWTTTAPMALTVPDISPTLHLSALAPDFHTKYETVDDQSAGLSKVGMWHPTGQKASDDPGTMTVSKLIPQQVNAAGETNLGVDGVEWRNKMRKVIDEAVTIPTVQATKRQLTTMHGETCAMPHDNTHEKPPLVTVSIDSLANLDEAMQGSASMMEWRQSQKAVVDGTTPGGLLSKELARRYEESQMLSASLSSAKLNTSTFSSLRDMETAKSVIKILMGERVGTPSTSRLPPDISEPSHTDRNWQAALDESYERYSELNSFEEAMLLQRRENELQRAIALHKKYIENKIKRREQARKEKLAMIKKRQADEDRYRRRAAALELEQKRKEAEEAEKAEKERQAELLLQERKFAKTAMQLAKAEKARKEREKTIELGELLAMRAEEKVSIAAEVAWKEKEAKIAAAKAAAEEKERLARIAATEKAMREEKERQRQAEAERQRQEAKLKAEEMKLMMQEQQLMLLEDVDAPGPVEEPKEEVVEEPVEEVVVEETPVEEPPLEGKALKRFMAKKKLHDFTSKIIDVNRFVKAHPRKKYKSKFYFPMVFGEDIEFNPFTSDFGHEAADTSLYTEDASEVAPVSDFSDITKTIKDYKEAVEKEKLRQLYEIKHEDIPAEQWTKVFRTNIIDWNTFMDEENAYLLEQFKDTAAPKDENSMLMRLRQLKRTSTQRSIMSSYQKSRASSLASPVDDEASEEEGLLHPLPFGRVVTDSVPPDCVKYYQVYMTDLSAILTIEVTAVSGAPDVFLSQGYRPSPIKFDLQGKKDCLSNKQVIVRFPHHIIEQESVKNDPCRSSHDFIIAVFSSETTCDYTIWATASASPPESPQMQNVSRSIRMLDVLASNSREDLWNYMPKLHRQAQVEAAKRFDTKEANAVRVLSSMGKRPELMNDIDAFETVSDDIDNLDSFLSRSGLTILKQELQQQQSESRGSTHDTRESSRQSRKHSAGTDPNLHPSLFLPPSLVDMDEHLSDDEVSFNLTASSPTENFDHTYSHSFSLPVLVQSGNQGSMGNTEFVHHLMANASDSRLGSTRGSSPSTRPVTRHMLPIIPQPKKHMGSKKKLKRLLANPSPISYTLRPNKM